jgi:hypothetical protein
MAGTALVAGPVGRFADRSRRRAVMAAIGDPANGAGRKITRFGSSMNSRSLLRPTKARDESAKANIRLDNSLRRDVAQRHHGFNRAPIGVVDDGVP